MGVRQLVLMEKVKPVLTPCFCHPHPINLWSLYHFSICSGGEEPDTHWQKHFWHAVWKISGSAKRNMNDVHFCNLSAFGWRIQGRHRVCRFGAQTGFSWESMLLIQALDIHGVYRRMHCMEQRETLAHMWPCQCVSVFIFNWKKQTKMTFASVFWLPSGSRHLLGDNNNSKVLKPHGSTGEMDEGSLENPSCFSGAKECLSKEKLQGTSVHKEM